MLTALQPGQTGLPLGALCWMSYMVSRTPGWSLIWRWFLVGFQRTAARHCAMPGRNSTLWQLAVSSAASPSLPNTRVCLKVATVPSAQSLRLLDFTFSDFELSDTETTLATVRMFVDLNLVQNFQMKYTVGTHLPSAFSWWLLICFIRGNYSTGMRLRMLFLFFFTWLLLVLVFCADILK